jgi:hypothetical protein
MDPDIPDSDSKSSQYIAILKDRFLEESIKWFISLCEIENLIPVKDPADKNRMFYTLLKVQSLPYFEQDLMRRLEEEDSEILDNEPIELVLRDMYIGLQYIPKFDVRLEKYYLRRPRGLYIDLTKYLEQFVKWSNGLNRYLLPF